MSSQSSDLFHDGWASSSEGGVTRRPVNLNDFQLFDLWRIPYSGRLGVVVRIRVTDSESGLVRIYQVTIGKDRRCFAKDAANGAVALVSGHGVELLRPPDSPLRHKGCAVTRKLTPGGKLFHYHGVGQPKLLGTIESVRAREAGQPWY